MEHTYDFLWSWPLVLDSFDAHRQGTPSGNHMLFLRVMLFASSLALVTAAGCRNPSPGRSDTDPRATETGATDWGSGGADTGDTDVEPPRTLANGSHTLEHDGMTRDFLLYVPEDLPVGSPLVVVLHGYGETADAIRSYAGMDAVADREGFAVVYPQGVEDSWGYPFWDDGGPTETHPDDVGFVKALRTLLVADQGLNPEAVFAAGFSNGAAMTYRLACQAAGDIRAVTSVAGCLAEALVDACSPSPDVPLFEIHGTEDRSVPWDGLDGYLDTLSGLGHLVGAYGLDTEDLEPLPDVVADDGSTVVKHRWWSKATDTEVWLYEIDGGRHDWPPATGNQDIMASDEIWAFFQSYL
jgi:polyhydroxybutyrate depolymerase